MKNRRLIRLFHFFIVIVSFLSVKSVSAQTFRILTEEFPPYNYTQDGKIVGISTEIVRERLKRIIISTVEGSSDVVAGIEVVREAYRRIGYDIQIQWFSGKKALEYSNGGKVDAELQRIDGISRKYENLIQIPIPINYVQAAVFTKDVTFPVRDWYSLKPYKIGIVKGIIFAKEGTRGMDVLETDSSEELVDRLEAGDIDIAVMPRISVLAEIKRQKSQDIKELEGVLETLFLYHYVHKKHAALVPKLEKELKRMLLDGTTRRLRTEAYKKLLAGEGK